MKKMYYISPVMPMFFLGAIVLYVLFTDPFKLSQEWFVRQSILVIPAALLSLFLWRGQAFMIKGEDIIRIQLFSRIKIHHLVDIISVKEDVGEGFYRAKSIKITFRNGDNFHVMGLSIKDTKDIIARIRAVVPDVVDSSVDDFIKKPY